jgi:hypothetical protein
MRGLPLFALVLSGKLLACGQAQIEAATTLMLQANPVINAKRQELREQSRQRDWSARLSLGYPLYGASETEEVGPTVGIQVEIPLFDRSDDMRSAKARTDYHNRQDAILNGFMNEMERLCTQAEQAQQLDSMRRFYHDRLAYRQEQVKEGLEEATVLWSESEKVQQAEHDYRREQGELVAMQVAIARRYGGEQWKLLQGLLVAASR